MLVANDLNLDVPGSLAQLHHEDWGAWDLCQDLEIQRQV
jgi:hypothetical protein